MVSKPGPLSVAITLLRSDDWDSVARVMSSVDRLPSCPSIGFVALPAGLLIVATQTSVAGFSCAGAARTAARR